MPCCKPKINPITDGLIIAGKPFAMEDNVGQGAADDFLQVMEKDYVDASKLQLASLEEYSRAAAGATRCFTSVYLDRHQ